MARSDDDDWMGESQERAVAGEDVAVSLAWFPGGDYEEAIERWPSLAEDWADVPHAEYCRRFESEFRRYSFHGLPVRGVAAIELADYLPSCADGGFDPELPETRARYAAELMRRGQATPWPPGRNDPCWCRSGRKYKRCCGTVRYQPDVT